MANKNKKLKWGKMRVFIALSGEVLRREVPTPVQNSFGLNMEPGEALEAILEGGELYATRQDASKKSFEFQVLVSEDLPKPIDDVDGVITDEYSMWAVPEDTTQAGFYVERAAVSVVESFTSSEGHRATYTFKALKPATGAMVKPYYLLTIKPEVLDFSNQAGNKTVEVTATGTVTAVSSQTWATVIVTGQSVKVTVTANAGAARTAVVTISAEGKEAAVPVTQESA
jgi:hypothetical protein